MRLSAGGLGLRLLATVGRPALLFESTRLRAAAGRPLRTAPWAAAEGEVADGAPAPCRPPSCTPFRRRSKHPPKRGVQPWGCRPPTEKAAAGVGGAKGPGARARGGRRGL